MTVIVMHLKTQSRNLRTVKRSRYYATSVLDHKNVATKFPAPITKQEKVQYLFSELPSSPGGVVAIRIAHSRPDGKSVKPNVYVNDVIVKSSSFSYDAAGGYREFSDGSYFGEFIVYYDLEDLTAKKNPKVSVMYPDSGGYSTTVVLEIDECSDSSCCVLAKRSTQTKCDGQSDSGKLRPQPTPMPK
ncbi:hypothetical protein NDN08_004409 [Rhodosorus marinus]|uniref:Beta-porphyranase A C-terminal domain-containing protein n=1 Tax=Rhodosorus marinus TaxID=101924 RepID=A0AAV8UL74_9RHOD|nr:hypothetical protein NDN08_004409 [Rhodosorus marinus]